MFETVLPYIAVIVVALAWLAILSSRFVKKLIPVMGEGCFLFSVLAGIIYSFLALAWFFYGA